MVRLPGRSLVRNLGSVALLVTLFLCAQRPLAQDAPPPPAKAEPARKNVGPRTGDKLFLFNLPETVPASDAYPNDDAVVLSDVWLLKAGQVVRCRTIYIRTARGLDWADYSVAKRGLISMAARAMLRDGRVILSVEDDVEDGESYKTIHLRAARPDTVIEIQTIYKVVGFDQDSSNLSLLDSLRSNEKDTRMPFFFDLGASCRTLKTMVYVSQASTDWVRMWPPEAWTDLGGEEKGLRGWSAAVPVISQLPDQPPVQRPMIVVSSPHPFYKSVVGDAPRSSWLAMGLEIGRWVNPDLIQAGRKSEITAQRVAKTHSSDMKRLPLAELEKMFTRGAKRSRGLGGDIIDVYWALQQRDVEAYLAFFREASDLDPELGPAGMLWFQGMGVAVRLDDGRLIYVIEDHVPYPLGTLPARYGGGWAWLATDYAHSCPIVRIPPATQPDRTVVRFDWTSFTRTSPIVGAELELSGDPAWEILREHGMPGGREDEDDREARRDACAEVWRDEASKAWFEPVGEPVVTFEGDRIRVKGFARLELGVPFEDGACFVRPFQASGGELAQRSFPDAVQAAWRLGDTGERIEEHLLTTAPWEGALRTTVEAPFEAAVEVVAPQAEGGAWVLRRTSRIAEQAVGVGAWPAFVAGARRFRAWNDVAVPLAEAQARALGSKPEEAPEEAPEVAEGVYLFVSHRRMGSEADYRAWVSRYDDKVTRGVAGDGTRGDYAPPKGGVLTLRVVFPAPRNLETMVRQSLAMALALRGETPSRVWSAHPVTRRFSVETDRWTRTRHAVATKDSFWFVWNTDLSRPWCIEVEWDVRDPLLVPPLPMAFTGMDLVNRTLDLPSLGAGWRAVLWTERKSPRGVDVEVRTVSARDVSGPVKAAKEEEIPVLILEPDVTGFGDRLLGLSTWASLADTYRTFSGCGAWAQETPAVPRAEAELLYHAVQREVRYVSIPVDKHRLVPHDLADIRERGWGDCKDMTRDLVERLRAAGVEAWPALVHTELAPRSGETPFPSFAWFNHVVAAVRGAGGTWEFWDSTADTLAPGQLRSDLHGRSFLVLTDPPEWVTTEPVRLEDSSLATSLHLTRAADGALHVEVTERASGPLALQLFEALGEMDEPARFASFQAGAAYFLEGITHFTAPEVERFADGRLTIRYAFDAPALPVGRRVIGIPGAYLLGIGTYGASMIPHKATIRVQADAGLEVRSLLENAPLSPCSEGAGCREIAFSRGHHAEPDDEAGMGKDPAAKTITLRNPPDAWFLLTAPPEGSTSAAP